MATLKKELKDILDKYGIDPRDKNKLWDCHGTLVLYHKAYEIIAAKENIKFDTPVMLETNSKEKIVALVVTGRMGDRVEWSFGEASPSNLKSTYPYAMAEKRAKDRVIAKLVGLAEHVYSEDEAEEFKGGGQAVQVEEKFTPENKSLQAEVITKIALCKDEVDISSILDEYADRIEELPEELSGDINGQIDNRRKQIKDGVTPQITGHKFAGVDDAIKWMTKMAPVVKGFKSIKVLDEWENYNRPWLNGLECLSAKKYLKDGKTPRERMLQALMDKRCELENINTANTPIG